MEVIQNAVDGWLLARFEFFGGIQEATQDALDTQFGPAHTGMIYTPPTFSDHIAISVLFEDSILPRDLNLDGNNVATRKAQPHKLQKSILAEMYDQETADATRILYGGSVTPDSVDNLMAQKDIDGALVGGASLDASKFSRIINFQA